MKKIFSFLILFNLVVTIQAATDLNQNNSFCPEGQELVELGVDDNGCMRSPICVDQNNCPSIITDITCPYGSTLVHVGYDKQGCSLPPTCVRETDCPMWVSPPPSSCPNGKWVSRGRNLNGCFKTPICVTFHSCHYPVPGVTGSN